MTSWCWAIRYRDGAEFGQRTERQAIVKRLSDIGLGMPDIVLNLLRLSSEVQNLRGLLGPALDLLATATKGTAGAIVRSAPPHWMFEAVQGTSRADIPLSLAADALEHGDVVVWGGPSRLFFHGVAPLADGEHALMGRQRINLTFRKVR